MLYKEGQEIQILPTWFLYNHFKDRYLLDDLIFFIQGFHSYGKYVVIKASDGLHRDVEIEFIRLVNDKIPNSIFRFLKSKS